MNQTHERKVRTLTGISIDPEYINNLAPYHEQAADTFGSAASVVSGSADKISASHGMICNASKDALKNVEEIHNKLAAALQEYSNNLAVSLRTAARSYEGTDSWAAKRLNNQMI